MRSSAEVGFLTPLPLGGSMQIDLSRRAADTAVVLSPNAEVLLKENK